MAAKATWEAARCSKHYGYQLKHKDRRKRYFTVLTVTPLAVRFYRLNSGHAATGAYLKWFGHLKDDIYWWCREGAVQTREYLFHHCT
jgi:hypothetical protein